ncbi:MAG TPA: hypothetical protein VM008_10185 [Phycisphaerae bacterium]|nr:hypothetical protein [Phycisphaerae bacterium]
MSVDVTGKVSFLKINPSLYDGDDSCLFGVIPTGTTYVDVFAVWWGQNLNQQPPPTAADWVLRTVQIAMIRDALVNKLDVVVTYEPPANTFLTLRLKAT